MTPSRASLLWSAIPVLVVIGLWETASRFGAVKASLFPPPSAVAVALWGQIAAGTVFTDLRDSLWRLGVGLGLGALAGVSIGLVTGRYWIAYSALAPIVQMLRPLPPVAIIPLVIVWFGIDNGAKVFSIAFAVFFPIWINTHVGAQNIPLTFFWSARLLTRSPLRIFAGVILPAALPFIITGVRTGIAIAFVMIFVSELAGASSGLGYRISVTQLAYRTDEMIAALFVLGAAGAAMDFLFVLATRKLFPWLALSQK